MTDPDPMILEALQLTWRRMLHDSIEELDAPTFKLAQEATDVADRMAEPQGALWYATAILWVENRRKKS